tara:strand:- start:172 stop:438 length:267 start_codon:yes stop_codon:yes gene_type:complete
MREWPATTLSVLSAILIFVALSARGHKPDKERDVRILSQAWRFESQGDCGKLSNLKGGRDLVKIQGKLCTYAYNKALRLPPSTIFADL